jgi:23S rRNA (adenine2503-C2)-methyltransferase
MLIDPRTVSPKVFEANCLSYGLSKPNARAFLGQVIGAGDLDPKSWYKKELIRKQLSEQLEPLPSLKLEKIITSEVDGFQKLVFLTHDNLSLETVIIPLHKENCVSICLSSQVGCVMACDFCATARMPKRRNLKSWEIINQMQQARHVAEMSGRAVTGAVFMGMGEPFLNYENVMIAAEHFCYPVLNAITSKAITISTVGLVQEIEKFIKEKRPFRLSISIGAAIDEKRKLLVPVAARTPIAELMQYAREYSIQRKERVNLAYVCVAGVNMFEEDAQALAELVGDTQIRLDLIEVNDTAGKYQRPTEQELKSFRHFLDLHLKQPVVRRYSGGSDIRAACGTLAGETTSL